MSKSWGAAPPMLKAYVGLSVVSLGWAAIRIAVMLSDGPALALAVVSLALVLPIALAIFAFLIYKMLRGKLWAWILIVVLELIELFDSLLTVIAGDVVESINLLMLLGSLGLLAAPQTRAYMQSTSYRRPPPPRWQPDSPEPPGWDHRPLIAATHGSEVDTPPPPAAPVRKPSEPKSSVAGESKLGPTAQAPVDPSPSTGLPPGWKPTPPK